MIRVLIRFTSCILVNVADGLEVHNAWVRTEPTVLAFLQCFLEGRSPGIASGFRRGPE